MQISSERVKGLFGYAMKYHARTRGYQPRIRLRQTWCILRSTGCPPRKVFDMTLLLSPTVRLGELYSRSRGSQQACFGQAQGFSLSHALHVRGSSFPCRLDHDIRTTRYPTVSNRVPSVEQVTSLRMIRARFQILCPCLCLCMCHLARAASFLAVLTSIECRIHARLFNSLRGLRRR